MVEFLLPSLMRNNPLYASKWQWGFDGKYVLKEPSIRSGAGMKSAQSEWYFAFDRPPHLPSRIVTMLCPAISGLGIWSPTDPWAPFEALRHYVWGAWYENHRNHIQCRTVWYGKGMRTPFRADVFPAEFRTFRALRSLEVWSGGSSVSP